MPVFLCHVFINSFTHFKNKIMNVKIEKQGNVNVLVIALPIAPTNSKTGKSVVIAGTSGFLPAGVEFDGKPIRVSVNAIVNK